MSTKLVIIGSQGFIGKRLTVSMNPAIFTNYKEAPYLLDLRSPDLKALPLSTETHVIIAAGCANINECDKNPEKTYAINVTGTLELAKQCREMGLCPILFSTDYVFNGEKGGYTESSSTCPINAYGKQKAELESRIHDVTSGNYLMLRLSKIYSTFAGDNSLLDEMMHNLTQEKAIRAAIDQEFCPLHVDDLVTITQELIDQNITGLINIGGQETLSRYALALKVCEALNISTTLVKPITLDELKGSTRPKKTTLNCKKLYETITMKTQTLQDSISKLATIYHNKNLFLNELKHKTAFAKTQIGSTEPGGIS